MFRLNFSTSTVKKNWQKSSLGLIILSKNVHVEIFFFYHLSKCDVGQELMIPTKLEEGRWTLISTYFHVLHLKKFQLILL